MGIFSALFSKPKAFSRYGGLWIDRLEVDEIFDAQVKKRQISEEDQERIKNFMRDGYIVIRNAVPEEAIVQYEKDLAGLWEKGHSAIKISTRKGEIFPVSKSWERETSVRIVDMYSYFESARQLLFSEKITNFLNLIFDDKALLFQSLGFQVGSQQGMHQDTAYVVTTSPLELAASWIAIEDIKPGSGELQYYKGSHRIEEYHFSGKYKHWNPERDGKEQHDEFLELLHEKSKQKGLPVERFLPKRGDALIWHADLVHGGAEVSDINYTRKSLVGHYCPYSVTPHYFSYLKNRKKIAYNNKAGYSTQYY